MAPAPFGAMERAVSRVRHCMMISGHQTDSGSIYNTGDGPYYGVELTPAFINTQGGPERNTEFAKAGQPEDYVAEESEEEVKLGDNEYVGTAVGMAPLTGMN